MPALSYADFSTSTLALALAAYLLGGSVKGVLGIGLPLIVVPLVATFVGPAKAVAIMFVPALTSNLLQAFGSGIRREVWARFWPAVLAIVIFAALGAKLLANVDASTASAALGVVVVFFCGAQFLRSVKPVPPKLEVFLTPLAASISGAIGGFTGFLGMPLVPYLIALRLTKDEFVSTIGLLYLFGLVALSASLWDSRVLTTQELVVSALMTPPTLLGVWLGSKLRHRIAQGTFHKLLMGTLFLVGLNLLRKSIFG